MNKVIYASLIAALGCSAFAQPLVYDYKASVKHMYLQQKKIKAYDKQDYEVYLKYQKSATLKGYLVMDNDGVTSQAVSGGVCDSSGQYAFDYGRARGFLVVMNSGAEKNFRSPKIIPAVLDGKYLDMKYTAKDMPKTGMAEGYLYLGGDAVQPVRPFVDLPAGGRVGVDEVSRATPPAPPAAAVPGMAALADYLWTSVYLFGQFNGPNWFDRAFATIPVAAGPFDDFEGLWDANLPTGVQIGFAYYHPYFHDTWMNGSGFGKYTKPDATGKLCCGLRKATQKVILESLSGSVKGGLFICTENLIDAENPEYVFFDNDMHRWEDQFNANRVVNVNNMYAGFTTTPDRWQNDMWNDGPFEQETTDVITGTWSIKLNTKFFADNGIYAKYGAVELWTRGVVNPGCTELLCSLVAASKSLDPRVTFVTDFEHSSYTGTNPVDGLPGITEEVFAAMARTGLKLPVATPAFLTYYGIAK